MMGAKEGTDVEDALISHQATAQLQAWYSLSVLNVLKCLQVSFAKYYKELLKTVVVSQKVWRLVSVCMQSFESSECQ